MLVSGVNNNFLPVRNNRNFVANSAFVGHCNLDSFQAKQEKNSLKITNFNTLSMFNQSLAFKAKLIKNYDQFKPLSEKEKQHIKKLIDNYKEPTNSVAKLGEGAFGIAYKLSLAGRTPFVVKVLDPNKHNAANYGGGNLKEEAERLKLIPKECKNSQQLLELFSLDNKEYLVTSFIPGNNLENISQPLNYKQLEAIVDDLTIMDQNGLMNYDCNYRNINLTQDSAGFFDYEFLNKHDISKPDTNAYNDFHNLSRNLYYPRLSCIQNFENRSFAYFFNKIEFTQGTKTANNMIGLYLKALSKHHSKMVEFLSSNSKPSKAIEYEKTLASLFANPSKQIIEIEKNLMDMKYSMVEFYLFKIKESCDTASDKEIETYGNLENYVGKVKVKAAKIIQLLNEFKKTATSIDEKSYIDTNLTYINNYLVTNANPFYVKFKDTDIPKKLIQFKIDYMKNLGSIPNNNQDFSDFKDKLLDIAGEDSGNPFLEIIQQVVLTFENAFRQGNKA